MSSPQAKYLTAGELEYVLKSLAVSHEVSSQALGVLIESTKRAAAHYPNGRIPREDAYKLLSYQLEITKSGYIRDPVDVVEFVESPEYLGLASYVRPAVLDHLIRLFDAGSQYYEVVLAGAIGIGKNYFADLANAYLLYTLGCSVRAEFALTS